MSQPTLSALRPAPLAAAVAATAVTMLALDLAWLGVLAKTYYSEALGPLERGQPVLLAAALFYAMYLAAIVFHAVLPAHGVGEAARRGAGLGFVAYATYELTNWAVLRFRPILMTTLAALLGAVPLALGTGVGAELRKPLGIAIVGGLLLSQLLTLFTTPVVYLALDWFSARARKARAEVAAAPVPRPQAGLS